MAILRLFKATFDKWRADKAPRLAAALAYYTLFSIAPLLVIAIGMAGLLFGQEMAQSQVFASLQELIGERGADAIHTMIENTAKPRSGIIATAAGVVTLWFGASGVFNQLKDALNTIWGVTPKPGRGVWGVLKARLESFLLVLGIGFLLGLSLIANAVVATLVKFLSHWLPGGAAVWQAVDLLVSFAVITVLFAFLYKILPDVKVAWSDVWIGAAVTSGLFALGRYLIGLYLSRVGIASLYGAAGSLVVLLLWVYYSAQILLFGAEFTCVYANRYGSWVLPDENSGGRAVHAEPLAVETHSGGSVRTPSPIREITSPSQSKRKSR